MNVVGTFHILLKRLVLEICKVMKVLKEGTEVQEEAVYHLLLSNK